MELYKPYLIKITTTRSKEEVIKSLSKKASFTEDQFKIPYSVFSFRRGSKVEGKVFTNDNSTVVEAYVLPSLGLKLVPALILILALIVFFVEAISLLKHQKFNFKFLFFFPTALILAALFYGITRINFWLSCQAQESFLRECVR